MYTFHHGVSNNRRCHYKRLLTSGRANKPYCFVAFTTEDLADGALRNLQGVKILGRPIRVEPRRLGPNRREGYNRNAESSWNDKTHVDTALHTPEDSGAVDNRSYEATHLLVLDLPVLSSYYGFATEIRELFRGFNV